MSQNYNLKALQDALNDRSGEAAIAAEALKDSMRQQEAYNTKRSTGLLSFLGESIFDSVRKKQTRPQHEKSLQDAINAATGVTEAEQDLARQQSAFNYQREREDSAMDKATDQGYKMALEEVKNKRGPLSTVNMPPNEAMEGAMAKEMGKQYAQQYRGWSDDAVASGKMEPYIQRMKDLNEAMTTGKGEALLAQAAQWFGAPAGSNYQQFMASQVPVMLQMAEQVSGPMTEKEWDMLRSGLASPSHTPESNAAIIQLIQAGIDRSKQNYSDAQAFYAQNKTLEGFVPLYSRRRDAAAPVNKTVLQHETDYENFIRDHPELKAEADAKMDELRRKEGNG